jgi:integrase
MSTTTRQRRTPLGLFPDRPIPRLDDRNVEAIHQQDLADGYDIRTVPELLGHKDVRTTMIDTHVSNRGGRGVRSPADGLTRGARGVSDRLKQPITRETA